MVSALVSANVCGQIVTRFSVPGGTATSAKITPGDSATFEVRLDATLANIGGSFGIAQASPATSGFFTITGRSFTGSVWDDAGFGTPDAIVLALPSASLGPANGDNLGRSTVDVANGAPAGTNLLALAVTLTAAENTPLGNYRIVPSEGNSYATDAAQNDFSMAGAKFDIIVGQPLTVSRTGRGSGTVSDGGTGAIQCGNVCSDIYPGTAVTLTATPGTGSTFAGWSGSGCAGIGTCTVTLVAPITVQAQFDTAPDLVPIPSLRDPMLLLLSLLLAAAGALSLRRNR